MLQAGSAPAFQGSAVLCTGNHSAHSAGQRKNTEGTLRATNGKRWIRGVRSGGSEGRETRTMLGWITPGGAESSKVQRDGLGIRELERMKVEIKQVSNGHKDGKQKPFAVSISQKMVYQSYPPYLFMRFLSIIY